MAALLQQLVRLVDEKASEDRPALLGIWVEQLAKQKVAQVEHKDE